MQLGLRGVMDADGDIHTWPTLLMDHSEAFATLPHLNDYRVRFRQWGNSPGDPIDFDPGASRADMMRVVEHVAKTQLSNAGDAMIVLDLARRSGVR